MYGQGEGLEASSCLLTALFLCISSSIMSINPKWLSIVTVFTTNVCVNRMVKWLERNTVYFTGKDNTWREICKGSVHALLSLTTQYFIFLYCSHRALSSDHTIFNQQNAQFVLHHTTSFYNKLIQHVSVLQCNLHQGFKLWFYTYL